METLMATNETIGSREWCVFRNLVHTVYREARHLGPEGDLNAQARVSGGPLLPHAEQCRRAREELKSLRLYELTTQARSTGDVLRPYQERTGLSVDDVIRVFNLPNWRRGYGGPRWATIAETLKELVSALEAGDPRARAIADGVFDLHHNHGPLVPRSRDQWKRNREKWPELCD